MTASISGFCGFLPAITIKSSRYTPEMSGTSPIVRKSTIPLAVRGLRNSSKYLARLEKLFPKSRKTRVSLSSRRIMLPLLQFARDGKEHTVDEAEEHLASHFNLTKEERTILKKSGGETTFLNR